jgi:hypothetical protein
MRTAKLISSWITRFTGQFLPALALDPKCVPADRRRLFLAPFRSEIKAKGAGATWTQTSG